MNELTGGADARVAVPISGHSSVADAAFRKIAWRLIPFLQLCFIVASMDRINVGFARAQLAHDLRLSDAAFGFGAGLFFVGYVLVEVPSNLILHRVGARRWLSRIMITWGIASAATAWVQSDLSFYVLRFLLGIAEAGFAPGVLLYLTYWLPTGRRGRLLAVFMTSLAISGVVAAPVSGLILGTMEGMADMHAWQWMFVLESLPAILLGIAALRWLPESPKQASWLDAKEREAVAAELAGDLQPSVEERLWPLLRQPGVWWFGLAYFMLGVGVFGITFWLPTIIAQSHSLTPIEVGLISAAPWAAAVPAMLYAGALSDRGAPLKVFAWGTGIGALALAGSALLLGELPLLVGALVIAAAGLLSGVPVFWRSCSATMRGVAAAGGIAIVNCIGSFAGFVGPALVGALKQASGGMVLPILAISLIVLGASLPLMFAMKPAGRQGA